jgi:hypothetical protein
MMKLVRTNKIHRQINKMGMIYSKVYQSINLKVMTLMMNLNVNSLKYRQRRKNLTKIYLPITKL